MREINNQNIGTENIAFVFLDTPPWTKSGAGLRVSSNVSALIELGYKVELYLFEGQRSTNIDSSAPDSNGPVVHRLIPEDQTPSLFGKVSYRLLIANQASFDYLFPLNRTVQRTATKLFAQFPNAIFFFDGESTASVIPWLPSRMKKIWSIHEMPGKSAQSVVSLTCELEERPPLRGELRWINFLQAAEQKMIHEASLLICINHDDREQIRRQFNHPNTEYLPMAVRLLRQPRKKQKCDREPLRILHVGAIAHLPSYLSLVELLETVLPRLPSSVRNRLQIDIVGTITDTNRSKRILSLAENCPNVKLHGFVDDIEAFYADSDLQIVASSDAVGTRTRIIESLAYGLPVLSTRVAAAGIKGLVDRKNILLEDTSFHLAETLGNLTESADILTQIAEEGRLFYEQTHSADAVAKILKQAISRLEDLTRA